MGAAGARLYFPDGQLQHAGVVLHGAGPFHPYHGAKHEERGYLGAVVTPRNYLAVTAACVLTPRAAFQAVGGFDESYVTNYNDVDYCLRLRDAGWRSVYVPHVELYHYETQRSDGHVEWVEHELVQFRRRWGARYQHDPFGNLDPCPAPA